MSVADVVDRVAAAARRSGRDPSAVRIVAAVKNRTHDEISQVIDAGITDLGCNRAQELRAHVPMFGPDVRWHYLGSIQTNKVRLLDPVRLVHGVDRAAEAAALQARGAAVDRDWDVLIEVNVAGEHSKQGVSPGEVDALLEAISAYPRVKPRGFMFVAPQVENPEDVRWVFTEARELRDRYASLGIDELSMGMSDDYEVAVEEGATIVRIGRALFPAKGT